MREIALSGNKAAGRVALVDDEDYERLIQFRWYAHIDERRPGRPHGPYARTTINATTSGRPHWSPLMHTLIMGRIGIDHANRDGLDNRRENLRPAGDSENGRNRPARLNCSSQYKGVYWIKAQGVWGAGITLHRERIKLGRFSDEQQAAVAYDLAARELHGDFAVLNFPDPESAPKFVSEDRSARLGYSSVYHGVSWNKRLGKWMAYASPGGKRIHIGLFSDEIEAAKAHDEAIRKHGAAEWRLNFPDQQAA